MATTDVNVHRRDIHAVNCHARLGTLSIGWYSWCGHAHAWGTYGESSSNRAQQELDVCKQRQNPIPWQCLDASIVITHARLDASNTCTMSPPPTSCCWLSGRIPGADVHVRGVHIW
eukprot:4173517-Amphidinium_carterae.4